MEEKIFYVYGHYRADTGEIFYIGKGTGDRAHSKQGRGNTIWQRISKKHGYRVEYIHENLSEADAFEAERQLIRLYGRLDQRSGILANMTDGGEGVTNITPELLEKRSRTYKENYQNLPEEEKEKKRAVWAQNTRTPEARKKNSEFKKQMWSNPEYKERLKKIFKEAFATPEAYANRSKARQKTHHGLVSPDGTVYSPIVNLKQFCITHNLNHGNIQFVLKGKRHHHKGWRKYHPTTNMHEEFFVWEDVQGAHNRVGA